MSATNPFDKMEDAVKFIHNITLQRTISDAQARTMIHEVCDKALGHEITPLRKYQQEGVDKVRTMLAASPGLHCQEIGRAKRADFTEEEHF